MHLFGKYFVFTHATIFGMNAISSWMNGDSTSISPTFRAAWKM